jgi:hypothetical protein
MYDEGMTTPQITELYTLVEQARLSLRAAHATADAASYALDLAVDAHEEATSDEVEQALVNLRAAHEAHNTTGYTLDLAVVAHADALAALRKASA